jgi:hypothetical protein
VSCDKIKREEGRQGGRAGRTGKEGALRLNFPLERLHLSSDEEDAKDMKMERKQGGREGRREGGRKGGRHVRMGCGA